MIDSIRKDLCTGCGACRNICPKDCISMDADEYGFCYPVVDYTKCIKCGQCINVCPIIGKPMPNNNFEDPKVFAGWSLDEEIRMSSTSGGIFSEFAKHILSDSGCVVGARYNEEHLVEHCMICSVEELEQIRQSKYIQSDIGDVFREVKRALSQDKVVGFCGSPCQVAGLLAFLKGNPEKLYTFDFICRGINSPKAYVRYLEMLEKQYKSTIKRVWFKNKTFGWNRFSTRIDFDNGEVYVKDRNTDLFMRGYIEQNLYMRSCCFDCHYKTLPRVADITLGDFWGVANYHSGLDSDKGTSLVMINSVKGEKLFRGIEDYVFAEESSLDKALPGNACIFENAVKNPNSEKFLLMLDEMPFDKSFKKIVKTNIFFKVYTLYIRRVFVFVKKVLCYIRRSCNG